MSLRRPVWALHVLVVGLAVHNLVMSQLWRAGVRGGALTVIASWKDVLLAGALLAVIVDRRTEMFRPIAPDVLALAFAGFVVAYAVIPQSKLGGGATHTGILYGARHDLLPVEAYFLGRGLALSKSERDRLVTTVLATAAGVAAYGLLDVYLVPLSFWRESAGWFQHQLGLSYVGLSHLPENFIYNAGNNVVFRRLTSTFLSPLATALSARRRAARTVAAPAVRRLDRAAAVRRAALDAHARRARGARRRARSSWPRSGAGRCRCCLPLRLRSSAIGFVDGYSHFAPRAHLTPTEQREQERNAAAHPNVSNDATSAGESSSREHLRSLRDGLRTVYHHPYGFGLGNSGVTAARTHVKIEAGESTYTELGVDLGLLGGAAVRRLVARAARAAALARRGWRPRSAPCCSSGCRRT